MDLLTILDMAADDDATVALRVDQEIPALGLAGTRYVIADLGARLVVVGTPKAASRCSRDCPELYVAATVQHARDALQL